MMNTELQYSLRSLVSIEPNENEEAEKTIRSAWSMIIRNSLIWSDNEMSSSSGGKYTYFCKFIVCLFLSINMVMTFAWSFLKMGIRCMASAKQTTIIIIKKTHRNDAAQATTMLYVVTYWIGVSFFLHSNLLWINNE